MPHSRQAKKRMKQNEADLAGIAKLDPGWLYAASEWLAARRLYEEYLAQYPNDGQAQMARDRIEVLRLQRLDHRLANGLDKADVHEHAGDR